MNAIEVNHVSKSYGRVKALDDVSFSVGKGEVFGLIGPDGAGKTTMFRILCTLLLPEQGTALVDGFDTVRQMKDIRRRVGYMPGRFSLYQDLTVQENLEFFATLFGTTIDEGYDSIKAIYSQIERFRDRKAGALSGGMKQKLALSCATTLFRSDTTKKSLSNIPLSSNQKDTLTSFSLSLFKIFK